jgi:hypothetical protein
MLNIPRKATLPIVCGIWIMTLLVSVHTFAVLPWFLDYYDFYQQSGGTSMQYPAAVTLFHRCYLIGVPVGLSIIGYGVHLLRASERRVDHIAWFVTASAGLVATWFLWVLLVERSFHELLFPA